MQGSIEERFYMYMEPSRFRSSKREHVQAFRSRGGQGKHAGAGGSLGLAVATSFDLESQGQESQESQEERGLLGDLRLFESLASETSRHGRRSAEAVGDLAAFYRMSAEDRLSWGSAIEWVSSLNAEISAFGTKRPLTSSVRQTGRSALAQSGLMQVAHRHSIGSCRKVADGTETPNAGIAVPCAATVSGETAWTSRQDLMIPQAVIPEAATPTSHSSMCRSTPYTAQSSASSEPSSMANRDNEALDRVRTCTEESPSDGGSMAPCDGPLLHGNGSVSALELSMQMQPKASSKEGSEIHCMAPPFPEDGDGEETAPWEWESVSEPGGYPIIIQVVLSDPSLSCVHCAAAEVPSARPKLQMQSEEFCPRLEPLCTSGYTASQKLEKDPAPVEEDRVPGQTVPEIWDLEACQGEEPKAGYERPATSEAGSEGHTRGWRHVLTPVSSPFSLACSEDSSQGLSGSKSMEQQVREVTLSYADVSSFDLQALAEQEPVGELAPLRSAQDCVPQKPTRSVHSVETGVGTGSSDVRTPIPPFGRTSHSSQKGVTPLHVAAETGVTEFVETLLRSGATVDAPTSDGFTPLHGAATLGRVEAVASLIAARADPSLTAGDGSSALHGAARNGHTETVALLLEKGSVVDVRDRSGGFTPLHDAAHAGHLSMVLLLLQNRADPTRAAFGTTTPLDLAVHGGHLEVAAALLAARAWPTPEPAEKMLSPLRLAARRNHPQILQLLLARLREAAVGA